MLRRCSVAVLILAAACSQDTQSPSQPPIPVDRAAFTDADVTVELLSFPSTGSGLAMAVNDSGRVFGYALGTNRSPRQNYSWPATTGAPVAVPAGSIWQGSANRIGDAAGLPSCTTKCTDGAIMRIDASSGPQWTSTSLSGGSPYDVNDSREFVGLTTATRTGSMPAFWASPISTLTKLPVPVGTISGAANAVNNAGDAVGYIRVTEGATTVIRAAVWLRTGSSVWNMQLLPGQATGSNWTAYDINDAKQVVATGGSGETLLYTPNGTSYDMTQVVPTEYAIPNLDRCGRVSGATKVGGATRAYVWQSGALTILPLPSGATSSAAEDIAAVDGGVDVVVGRATLSSGTRVPARWSIPECGQ